MAIYSNSAGLQQYDPEGGQRLQLGAIAVAVAVGGWRFVGEERCRHAASDAKTTPAHTPNNTTGEEAEALEASFGIHCLRHRDKKPAGSCDELESHFG